MAVYTAKLLSLYHMLGLECSKEEEMKYSTFREGSYWGAEKQYFILSTFSTPLSSLSHAFFFHIKQTKRKDQY